MMRTAGEQIRQVLIDSDIFRLFMTTLISSFVLPFALPDLYTSFMSIIVHFGIRK